MRILVLAALLFTTVTATAQTSDTIRVCTYNLLQFGDDDVDRVDEFRMILNEVRPSVLCVQELTSWDAIALFRDSVAEQLDRPLEFAVWSSPVEGQYEVLTTFYDPTRLEVIEAVSIVPSRVPSKMPIVFFRHLISGDTLTVVNAHWKAGDEPTDREARTRAQTRLQSMMTDAFLNKPTNRFPAGDNMHIVLAGDLNIYDTDERAWEKLTYRGWDSNQYWMVDPIDRPGEWHDNPEFSDIHSQSTRGRQFGGGVQGGLDDRFDMVLMERQMVDHYVEGSYTTFGNDGQHFNDSVNAPTNTAVSAEMAQALHDASDHLPVFADFVFRKTTSVEVEERVRVKVLDLSEGESRSEHTDPAAHRRESPERAAGR